jgi:hypothetical protein
VARCYSPSPTFTSSCYGRDPRAQLGLRRGTGGCRYLLRLRQPGDPGLRSPLADALALAAVAGVDVPADLYLAGLGLDGELPTDVVRSRLIKLGATNASSLSSDVLSEEWLDLLTWHPSEATALWVAAGLGLRGIVEIRDTGTPVTLTDDARDVWALGLSQTIEATQSHTTFSMPRQDHSPTWNPSSSNPLGDPSWSTSGQGRLTARDVDITPADLEPGVTALQDAARSRGASYVTFRRLAEGLGCPSRLDAIRVWLIQAHAERYTPPLWSVAA